MFVLGIATLSAQAPATGTIEGRIINATNGSYLNNVRVAVQNTLLETTTNQSGNYRIAGVPAGTANLSVTFTGLAPQVKPVAVTAGQAARVDFDMLLLGAAEASSVVKLEAFTVEERELSAQGAALQEQRNAANIKNVVAMEEFGDLGITNPGHFLTYVPGVSNVYNTTGEVEGIGLRGMASSGTVVMIDGAQAASNDPASRSYNFSGTSTANLDRIEVTKVPTPDLPANAVGGSINMVTRSGFNRRTPLFSYNILGTIQAKGTHGNFPKIGEKLAGTDDKTTTYGIQPGFDLSYIRPVGNSFAFTLSAGRNARYQDREYMSPTWDRVRGVQTLNTLNSVINIFYQDVAAIGADWKLGRNVFGARVDVAHYNAVTRQNQFASNFGTGATGGEKQTIGAATGVGTLTQTAGANPNQYRRLLNGRINHVFDGDIWRFDWTASYSEARRSFSDIDEGMFYSAASSLSNLVISADGLDGISSLTMPRLTVRTRTGEVVNPYDTRQYTLNTATTGRTGFENQLSTAAANVRRSFATALPLTLRAGAAVERTKRNHWIESKTWNFRPPVSDGGQIVGNYDLIAEEYSARRTFNGGVNIPFVSTTKLYKLYEQHPEYFQLNEAGAHTNQANTAKIIKETISAAYIRADVKAFENRLWLVGGVRFERTDDDALGPLNDIRKTYQRNAAGEIILGANGRPLPIVADALTLAQLQYTKLGARSERSYDDFYPSLNASFNLSTNFVIRAAFARTIGRPDLANIIPGTTISDPSVASPTITVVNTGLEPWTANNYDLSLESYEFKGATIALSGFRKEISKFFTNVRIPATQSILDEFGLTGEDLVSSNYDVVTKQNSTLDASVNGLEWSWRQSLQPVAALPNWARSFGFFINGTHLRIGGPGAPDFLGYSTRIINWGASYVRRNFAVKLNASYSNGPRTALVAASAVAPAGTYSAVAPRTLLGGSIEYRINRRLTLHLSGQNLTDAKYRGMTYAPGAPSYTNPAQFRDLGIAYVFGVKGSF